MTKTETQIAEENIKLDDGLVCAKHKATCQRWLEFLEKKLPNIDRASPTGQLLMDLQITDLKQAIKLYNEAGI